MRDRQKRSSEIDSQPKLDPDQKASSAQPSLDASSPTNARRLKGLIWLQIALIGLCVVVYAVVWLRVQPLIAARQQLLQEIKTQQQQRDELQKQIAALKEEKKSLEEQKNSLIESARVVVALSSSLPGTGRQVEELKSEAVKAWKKVPPKQAWCYQERDPRKPGEKQYSVYCHWSQDRCNTAKSGSKIATSCALVPNVDTADWQPSAKGYMDSWFQLDRTSPLPPPFPQDFPGQRSAETTSPPKKP